MEKIIPGTVYVDKCDSTGFNADPWYKYIIVLGQKGDDLYYLTIGFDWNRKNRPEVELWYKSLVPSTMNVDMFWSYLNSGTLKVVAGDTPFTKREIEDGFNHLKKAIHNAHMMYRSVARYGRQDTDVSLLEIGKKVKNIDPSVGRFEYE